LEGSGGEKTKGVHGKGGKREKADLRERDDLEKILTTGTWRSLRKTENRFEKNHKLAVWREIRSEYPSQ